MKDLVEGLWMEILLWLLLDEERTGSWGGGSWGNWFHSIPAAVPFSSAQSPTCTAPSCFSTTPTMSLFLVLKLATAVPSSLHCLNPELSSPPNSHSPTPYLKPLTACISAAIMSHSKRDVFMARFEVNSSCLEYDRHVYDIVYSDDNPDFVYIPRAPPIVSLLPHQFFRQEVQKQPPADLFEAEDDSKSLQLGHLQI